ncbi:hypothetical protein HN592_03590 [Candidatus Woesearchaeota archaeon]|jgi:hypothetical protein|nr:hypothetical protein [Candidatus Woesearchaeota archaeon]MBT4368295.1 hypothetical protein [Candidatus Woesearchaeota archaeon]MBT4712784.1 hypothetical protein [Candidatus Woesearchaeota archaeon]MBT6639696.1 hypothetical protein [Candidatus Woesearchaeota archaeon]MBT7133868.1 hypothetical protein [Candidatus Woesearchaeota archaeon]
MNTEDLPAGYRRHPNQEFTGETSEPFFRTYCGTCYSTGNCPVQNKLMTLIGQDEEPYWHPSLVALAVDDKHPGLKDHVMCTEYRPTPARSQEIQLEFETALTEACSTNTNEDPFWFPDMRKRQHAITGFVDTDMGNWPK